ncbi:hypothetical protein OG568_46560 [Streptomyces sp. NBC_01450]|uniref:hypothetical protein n=1 Tax=Streptomyces sp. NBC_01450 TaxID=2903871 RepID=UPI002E2F695A|nr:hypothetical protein [Streptomyces sp. NBC_01450]
MRDGSGGEYSVLFSAAGAYVRGCGHESSLNAETTLSDLAGEIGETGCPGTGRDSA